MSMNDAFEHFNVSWNVGKNKKKLIEFFEKLMVFRTEDSNIKKLKKVRSVKKK